MRSGRKPSEVEIRQLHQLIMAGEVGAGEYRTRMGTKIKNQPHVPPDSLVVPQQMRELSNWWLFGEGHPVLTATVVHAWLTHIHPFEDGNGRLARLLANIAVTADSFPPLIVRSNAERGRSTTLLLRVTPGTFCRSSHSSPRCLSGSREPMSKDGYIRALLQRTFLQTSRDRFIHWSEAMNRFRDAFEQVLHAKRWEIVPLGYPEIEEFELLGERDTAGALWWSRLHPIGSDWDWMAWLGYNTKGMAEFLGPGRAHYPSIFFSPRDRSPSAVHPYRPRIHPEPRPESRSPDVAHRTWKLLSDIPYEIVVLPRIGRSPDLFVRSGSSIVGHAMQRAAVEIADPLVKYERVLEAL